MDFQNLKYLVVGSGFFGATIAERIASQLNEHVLVIDKRPHIGGNCFSEFDESTGIEYHKYGTHIFHTSNQLVWEYINQFTSFNGYRHQVLTTYKNKVYQMPINLETINSYYNLSLKPFEVQDFLLGQIGSDFSHSPENFEEKAISLVGRPLYEAFIKGYTKKQWGQDPTELPADLLRRLPFRHSYDESYYHSKWQGIPEDGYTKIFEKMVSHPRIELKLNTDFFDIRSLISPQTLIIYSGPIDAYFDYCFGRLEWRTLHFEKSVKFVEDYQGTSVMNFAEETIPYTRIHEPRHLHPERTYNPNKTVVLHEYSRRDNGQNPYYPLHDLRNRELVLKYRELADESPQLIISGRLGDYKYYDMHDTINNALLLFAKQIKPANAK